MILEELHPLARTGRRLGYPMGYLKAVLEEAIPQEVIL